jgi:uncharacterized protein (DUF305 family)
MPRIAHLPLCRAALLLCLPLLAACSIGRNIGPPPTPTAAPPASSEAAPPPDVSTPAADAYDMDALVAAHPDTPYDVLFIDRMTIHALSTVDATNQCTDAATLADLADLCTAINTSQQANLSQLQQWRAAWYPDQPTTTGAGMTMASLVLPDPQAARFDERFVEALLPHYAGMLALAEHAAQNAEHPELRELASQMVILQQPRLEQMQALQAAWDDAEAEQGAEDEPTEEPTE